MVDPVKDASSLYEVERRAQYGARPGFRITELQISPTQKVPWHYHGNVQDTFYVIEGALRIFLQNPKEEVRLARGQTLIVSRPTIAEVREALCDSFQQHAHRGDGRQMAIGIVLSVLACMRSHGRQP